MNTKSALVIRASRGLGYALAKEFLARGWHVVATIRDNKNGNALHELAGQSSGKLGCNIWISSANPCRGRHLRIVHRSSVTSLIAPQVGPKFSLFH